MKNITVSDILKATGGILAKGDKKRRIADISIDSRSMPSGDTLFIPLIGERADAHDFIADAVRNGAIACIASDLSKVPFDITDNVIEVADTKKALQDIGRFYRMTRDIKLAAVTGSVGKTTTREMIAEALLSVGKDNVYQTKGNLNSQVGVPITLCGIADEKVGVVELGMSCEGEIEILSKIAQPDVAVITTIGVAHIEQLKSRENICREKMSVTKGLKPEGCVLLNGDDPYQQNYRHKLVHRSYLYGTSQDCDFFASDIKQTGGGMKFKFHTDKGGIYDVYIPAMGIHNVCNATAAIAAACIMGADISEAVKSISLFAGVKMRQQVYEKNGITIIDDSYNANPDSMRAGLKVLSDYGSNVNTPRRKIALLADMKELGENEVIYHEEIGKAAAELDINMLLTVGELAGHITDACKATLSAEKTGVADNAYDTAESKKGDRIIECMHFENNGQAVKYLNGILKAGDVLYVKGSRSMALDKVIAELKL